MTLFRQEDWEDTLSNKSMNEKWDTFLKIYNKTVRACVSFYKNKQELSKPKWMNRLQALIRKNRRHGRSIEQEKANYIENNRPMQRTY